ncbi:MAG: S8 family peptidase [Gammaproteobacteria bacterium]|nr:S8 family peptidase [Gammaproteobacteria bacterium]
MSYLKHRGCAIKVLVASLIYCSLSAPIMAGQSEAMAFASISAQPVEEETDRIIVKYSNESTMGAAFSMPDAQVRALSQRVGMGLRHVRRLANGAHLMKLQSKQSANRMQAMITRLNADPHVEYAEPDRKMYPLAVPNDSRYNEQWHYYEATGGLNLPNAWDSAQGTGVVVAVIDTGYLPHADLVANILPGYDMISDATIAQDGDGRDADATDNGDWAPANACYFGSPAMDSSWHGTHVAGTVAAVTNNGSGVAGVAYDAKVLPVRVLGRCGGYTSDIADGMIWAAGGAVSGVPANPNPAQVLNLSLGGTGTCSTTTQNAINTARSLGATVVVAAGNSNADANNSNPANCNGVVAVAATDRTGGRAYYSNYGPVVDVAAPGGDVATEAANGILSTLNTGTTTPVSDSYAFYQGTSMATPHVAGAAALMYEVDPAITPDQVESTLKATTRAFPATCNQCGAGIVDATAAVEAASGVTLPPPPPADNVLENGVHVTNLAAGVGQSLSFTMDVPEGMTSLSFSISGGTGDADLYVNFGSAPTLSSYDCRPYLNGNAETCTISNVQAGTYYVMVQAYSAFSGVTLVGNYEAAPVATGDGFTETNLSASRGQWLHFTLDVPSAMSAMNVKMSGGTGDADLYVNYGATPTTRSYDCRPYLNGNNESCSFTNPPAGRWYISIRAYRSFSEVTLDARYTP